MEKGVKVFKNCEICKRPVGALINVGVDVGFHLGDYGKGEYENYKVEPKCISVFSIYLCSSCKAQIEAEGYFHIDVIPQLRDLIKEVLFKNMIIEGLK